jgi:lipid-A-disaccharide synthase
MPSRSRSRKGLPTKEPELLSRKAVIVTGELSGETHAVRLVRALTALCPMQFSGIGSTALADAGVDVICDYRKISLIGINEIFRKAGHIRTAYKVLKKHLVRVSPDVLILVDFGLFNLRLVAPLARRLSIPTVYFIPPQVWASRKGRIKQINSTIDLVLSILPFEEDLYREHHIPVRYVGHPYALSVKPLHSREAFRSLIGLEREGTVITMMPGSRVREVQKHMPVLLQVADRLDRELGTSTILLPVADSLDENILAHFLKGRKNIIPVKGLAHDCLAYSEVAVIASGSAALEAAVIGTPSVVIYKVSLVEYLLARMIVKVPYISLPNLIAGKEVFPEFVQSLDPERIAKSVLSMLRNDASAVRRELESVRNALTTAGPDPYAAAGKEILRFLEQTYGPLSQTP